MSENTESNKDADRASDIIPLLVTESDLAEALQDAWNDHCADTGCIPSCFEYVGDEIYANFEDSGFVGVVWNLLKSRTNARAEES